VKTKIIIITIIIKLQDVLEEKTPNTVANKKKYFQSRS